MTVSLISLNIAANIQQYRNSLPMKRRDGYYCSQGITGLGLLISPPCGITYNSTIQLNGFAHRHRPTSDQAGNRIVDLWSAMFSAFTNAALTQEERPDPVTQPAQVGQRWATRGHTLPPLHFAVREDELVASEFTAIEQRGQLGAMCSKSVALRKLKGNLGVVNDAYQRCLAAVFRAV